jgi:hypothetical protein
MPRYCNLRLFDLEKSFFGLGHFHNFRFLHLLDLVHGLLKLILHCHKDRIAYVLWIQIVDWCLLHPALYAEVCLRNRLQRIICLGLASYYRAPERLSSLYKALRFNRGKSTVLNYWCGHMGLCLSCESWQSHFLLAGHI